jgi:hypothetical protein
MTASTGSDLVIRCVTVERASELVQRSSRILVEGVVKVINKLSPAAGLLVANFCARRQTGWRILKAPAEACPLPR